VADRPKIEVASDDEAEEADFLVCVRASEPSVFDDDLYDFCCKCSEKVRHRPHAPIVPKRICMVCAMAAMAEGEEPAEHCITETSLDEARRYLKRS